MNKKRRFWVLFGVLVVVGAFLFVLPGTQNQMPLVPDVNAQNQFMSDFSNFSGFYTPSFDSYAGAIMPPIGGHTMDICYPDCGWTQRTCSGIMCGPITDDICGMPIPPQTFNQCGPPKTTNTCNVLRCGKSKTYYTCAGSIFCDWCA